MKLVLCSLFLSVFFMEPILNPASAALARKKSPPRAFSFIEEGGKASQAECDGERKLPRLKRLKQYAKSSSYMGSEMLKPEIKGKIDGEMWKHFFRVKASCNQILAKTPSALDDKTINTSKDQIPPEENDDSEQPEAEESGPT